jgi:hypothetical protein
MQLLVSSVFLTMLGGGFPELCHMSGCPCVLQALERNPVYKLFSVPLDALVKNLLRLRRPIEELLSYIHSCPG